MKPPRKHPGRLARRLVWMMAEFLLMAARYAGLLARGKPPLGARARWLQHSSRRLLPVLALEVRTRGSRPERGLLVCNHLSYLDIVVLASLFPAVFVAKQDMKHWPVFGWFAAMAGTLFVDRNKRLHVGAVSREIDELLQQDALIVLFPE